MPDTEIEVAAVLEVNTIDLGEMPKAHAQKFDKASTEPTLLEKDPPECYRG